MRIRLIPASQHHTSRAVVGRHILTPAWMSLGVAWPQIGIAIFDTHITTLWLFSVIGSLNSIHSHGRASPRASDLVYCTDSASCPLGARVLKSSTACKLFEQRRMRFHTHVCANLSSNPSASHSISAHREKVWIWRVPTPTGKAQAPAHVRFIPFCFSSNRNFKKPIRAQTSLCAFLQGLLAASAPQARRPHHPPHQVQLELRNG